MRWLVPVVIVAGAAPARAQLAATCEYSGSYYYHGDWDYCQVEDSVPEGCPIHLVVNDGAPAVRATVNRGGATVDVTGAITATPRNHDVATVDVVSCDCAAIRVGALFDETTIALVGVRAGEFVEVPGGGRWVGPAAPCPAVDWPQTFVEHVACDRCPEQDPPPHAAGCAAAGAPGWFAGALAALALAATRRHRHRPRRRD